jgi:hypothetical protein
MKKETALREYAAPPNTTPLGIITLSLTAINSTTLCAPTLSMTTQYE